MILRYFSVDKICTLMTSNGPSTTSGRVLNIELIIFVHKLYHNETSVTELYRTSTTSWLFSNWTSFKCSLNENLWYIPLWENAISNITIFLNYLDYTQLKHDIPRQRYLWKAYSLRNARFLIINNVTKCINLVIIGKFLSNRPCTVC